MIKFILLFLIGLHEAFGDSCVGRCATSHDTSYSCQCNQHCDKYGDCCADYIELCVPDGTCAGRCDENFDLSNACHCTPECAQYNDCCVDYSDVCGNGGGSTQGSCSGRCDDPVDSSQPCQCNYACESYGDCCQDYDSVCSGTGGSGSVSDSEILDLTLQLFDLDVNRATSLDIEVNMQSSTSSSSDQDKAPEKFFTYVNEDLLSRSSYRALINLLDNYDMFQGRNEITTATETAEQNVFLDYFMSSNVGSKLYSFFSEKGLLNNPDQQTFKEYLGKMWFEFYSRKNGADDTSGFEHVFVGEIKSSSVSGFHNWVQFYLLEQEDRVDYYGYVSAQEPDLYGFHFTWDGFMKSLGGSAVGASAEYELAVFTLCHVVKPNSVCRISMRNNAGAQVTRQVQTYTWSNSSPGSGLKYVASAYFIV